MSPWFDISFTSFSHKCIRPFLLATCAPEYVNAISDRWVRKTGDEEHLDPIFIFGLDRINYRTVMLVISIIDIFCSKQQFHFLTVWLNFFCHEYSLIYYYLKSLVTYNNLWSWATSVLIICIFFIFKQNENITCML